MRAYVFTDKALSSQAGRFVWLALDTEKSRNAPVLKKYPVRALPTYFIVDAAEEKPALRWVGGATVAQLGKMLDEGRVAVGGSERGPNEALAKADRSYGDEKFEDAVKGYREALAIAPPNWPSYSRAVESLLFSLQSLEKYEEGVGLAQETMPRLEGTPSYLSLAVSGLDCALSLPDTSARRAEWAKGFEAQVRSALADPSIVVAADDRSGAYGELVDARKAAGDSAGAVQTARAWANFLERQAAKAKTPDERAVFDSHRLSAYIEMGEPEKAIPMLEASERDLPGDYNPPARLATAYKAMKRWDEALKASDRALTKVYGPRKLLVLRTRADIYEGMGDREMAAKTIEEAIKTAQALPPEQRSESTLKTLSKRLDGLRAPPATSSRGSGG